MATKTVTPNNKIAVEFQDYWTKPILEYPQMSDEELTEQTGYATTEQLVELVIRSGEALEDYRHAVFDASQDERMESVPLWEIDPVLVTERLARRQAMRAEREEKAKAEEAKKQADIQAGEAKKLAEAASQQVVVPPSPTPPPNQPAK
jgi:Fe2+ transport system protein B